MAAINAILAAVNVALALLNASIQVRLIRRSKGDRWLRYLDILVSLYWAAIYAFIFITEPYDTTHTTTFAQIFIRPAITFTLALMTSAAIYRYGSGSK